MVGVMVARRTESGGGSTDIRINGQSLYDEYCRRRRRRFCINVDGGREGGGAGGGLVGGDGGGGDGWGKGGTQTAGGRGAPPRTALVLLESVVSRCLRLVTLVVVVAVAGMVVEGDTEMVEVAAG